MMLACVGSVHAADLAPVITPIAPASGVFDIFHGVEFHVQGEAGILGNSLNPSQGVNGEGYNFGQWYTDHANELQLNQVLVTVTKPVDPKPVDPKPGDPKPGDPKPAGTSVGFTLQGLYGSDTRYNHYLGIGDTFMGSERNQLNVTQAFLAAHLPLFTAGGVEVKAGLFTSPQGFETLDPTLNTFYSHSYTYNYATTFNHTGIFTTTHLNATLDIPTARSPASWASGSTACSTTSSRSRPCRTSGRSRTSSPTRPAPARTCVTPTMSVSTTRSTTP